VAKTRYHGGFQFPAHLMFKNKVQKPPPPAPRPLPPPVVPFPEGLVSFSSGKKNCGVNEYSVGLAMQMRLAGAEVVEAQLDDAELLFSARPGAELLVHVEPSLLKQGFDAALRTAYLRRAKIVICFHYFDANLLQRFAESADVLVVHRDYKIKHPKIRQVPLACPVYAPPDHTLLRQRLGFKGPVITTLGFLSAWKRIPEMADLLLPELGRRGATLQLLCPTHYSGDKTGEGEKLKKVVKGSGSALWIQDFLPEAEMLHRVAASDLGVIYHGANTGSCSAANKMFVSARCPLVVTGSNHDSDVKYGVARSSGFDLEQYVARALALLDNAKGREALRLGMEKDYQNLNQAAVAKMYLELFKEISK
jgi:hypothetical protein